MTVELDIVQHGKGASADHDQRALQPDQIRRDGVVDGAVQAYRQAWPLLAREARAICHRHLVRRDRQDAATADALRAEQADRGRRRAAARGVAAEGGGRERMRQAERGRLALLRSAALRAQLARRKPNVFDKPGRHGSAHA
jgi:hypothetical protein